MARRSLRTSCIDGRRSDTVTVEDGPASRVGQDVEVLPCVPSTRAYTRVHDERTTDILIDVDIVTTARGKQPPSADRGPTARTTWFRRALLVTAALASLLLPSVALADRIVLPSCGRLPSRALDECEPGELVSPPACWRCDRLELAYPRATRFDRLRVVAFNVWGPQFDAVYNNVDATESDPTDSCAWFRDKLDGLAHLIGRTGAPVVVLNEIDRHTSRVGGGDGGGGLDVADQLRARLEILTGERWYARFGAALDPYGRCGQFGNAILSTAPITAVEDILEPQPTGTDVRGALVVDTYGLRVVATHWRGWDHTADRGRCTQCEALASRIRDALHSWTPAVIAGDFNRTAASLAPFFRAEDGFRMHTGALRSTVVSASYGAIDHIITRNLTVDPAEPTTWCPSFVATCPGQGALGTDYVSDHLQIAIDIERQWSTLLPLGSTLDAANALFADAGLTRRRVHLFERIAAPRARAQSPLRGSPARSSPVRTTLLPWRLVARATSPSGAQSMQLQ